MNLLFSKPKGIVIVDYFCLNQFKEMMIVKEELVAIHKKLTCQTMGWLYALHPQIVVGIVSLGSK